MEAGGWCSESIVGEGAGQFRQISGAAAMGPFAIDGVKNSQRSSRISWMMKAASSRTTRLAAPVLHVNV